MTGKSRSAASMDLVVRGGQVVLSTGVHEADIGIAAGRIAALASPGTLSGTEVLEVSGLHVLPGAIDPHTHPGNMRGFDIDMAEETRAAAAGGVTAILGSVKCTRMGQPFKEVTTPEDVCSYHDVFEGARSLVDRSHVDVGFNYMLMDDRHAHEIPTYAAEHGVRSFKFFVGARGPTPWAGRVGLPVVNDDGTAYVGFREAAKIGALAMVHAENQAVARALHAELADAEHSLGTWAAHSPGWAEADGVRRAAFLAAQAGVRLYVVHITSAEGAAEVARAKAERPGWVFGETCPQYFSLHDQHPAGLLAKCSPPVHGRVDNEALWQAMEQGAIDVVGTDSIHRFLKDKLVEGDIWRTAAGVPGHETMLPLLLSPGRLPLERIAELTSTNAAKLFGLWPEKGAIQVGAEASLTLVDLRLKKVVHSADLFTMADWTPFESMELTGWPVMALLRGRVIMIDGKPVGPPTGTYLFRETNFTV